MNKLIYCSSLDHLNWYVPSTCKYKLTLDKSYLNSDIDKRFNLMRWINEECIDEVYAWNHCESPGYGAASWGDKISPSGNITLYFANADDHTKAVLTHSDTPTSIYN